MKAKVIKTTDGNYLGKIYEIDDLDIDKIKQATGGKFIFDSITTNNKLITLKNSNYTAILKKIN